MKAQRHAKQVLAMALTLFALAACGGGGGSSKSPAPTPTDAPTAPGSPENAPSNDDLADEGLSSFYGRSLDGEYASVVSLRLSLLGMPSDLGVERIKIVEGKDLVQDLMVVDGEIRFITPADRGRTETIKMVIEGNTTRRPLEIDLGSLRFLEIADTTEHYDDDPDKEPVLLKVHGLGPGNSIGHEGLVFEVDRDVELHPKVSNALLDVAGDGTLSLQKHWQPLPSKRGFSISHEALKTLLARLPDGDIGVSVNVNGYGKDNSFSRSWTFVMHVPVAGAEGRIIDSDTQEVVRTLAGRKVAIRGTGSNGTRAVAMVDAEGRFSINGLSAGTYVAELLDSRLPGFVQTLFDIKQSDTKVQLTLPYSTRAYRALTSTEVKDEKDAREASKPTKKQTTPTPSNAGLDGTITGSNGCYRLDRPGGGYSFGLASDPREPAAAHSCSATVTIPEGMQSISLSSMVYSYIWQLRVSSEQGHRDDSWLYRITGLPKPISNSGSSEDGFVRGGLHMREGCIDVSKLTKNGPHQFSIDLRTSGTGNRDAISLNIYPRPNCEAELRVQEASFSLINAKAHKILIPVNYTPEGRPNYPGAYISLSGKGDPHGWGIPMTIRYEPEDATIREIKLVMTNDAGPHEEDIKKQATFDKKGEITFKDLVLPEAFALPPFSGPVTFAVIIRGDVKGVDYTSDPFPVRIEKAENSSFTPLFHAGGMFDANRRYGQGKAEEGGDAWAAKKTLNWLQQNRYRFNDISAQHVAQHKSSGRSVLSHAGHSDGMQLDLRYADGTGGYSEHMGGVANGAYIKQLFEDAEADAYEKNMKSSPNISLAIQWVMENRRLIEREAPRSRIIYAGDNWMRSALYDGEFSPGKKIPYDGEGSIDGFLPIWTSKPGNVDFKPQHLHHWHISLSH